MCRSISGVEHSRPFLNPSVPTVCEVALPIPGAKTYSYAIPTALADLIVPGIRVVVPVRSREMVGIVCRVGRQDPTDLKPLLVVPDAGPLLTPPLLELADWITHYYGGSLGWTLKAMLPAALWGKSTLHAILRDASLMSGGTSAALGRVLERRGGRASATALRKSLGRPVWDVLQRLARVGAIELEVTPPSTGPAPATEAVVVLSRRLPSLMEREDVFGRARRQREAFELLDELGGEVARTRMMKEFNFSRAVLTGLERRGLVTIDTRESFRDPFTGVAVPPPDAVTPDQQKALDVMAGVSVGGAVTMFGVTGSGKTLVYLEAMRKAVDAGGSTIVLVPEIALTPQTIARVRGVFGDRVAVLHSGLSDGERADAWRALASGNRNVVVGARSAIFAPVRNLAVIVVDEEHDASYKNSEAPRYHARDVALRRGTLEAAKVILGSATPSLETWNARDAIPVVRLPHRVTENPLPTVDLIDLRSAPRVAEAGPVPWTEQLDAAVEQRLRKGEQVILLLNRRGFAHFLQCTDCGGVPECSNCSIALTVHQVPAGLKCHYCGFERAVPVGCDVCGGKTQRTKGIGTQSLERWVTVRHPEARLARMDADTTATKWAHQRILDAFGEGGVDVLLGTQMIAKGLDFPGVTLVGVVNADTGLHLPDFRAAERTFQLISQVAGRAGRGPKGGEVLVQTRSPDHYALRHAVGHDYEGFAARELDERTDPAYPPHVGLINVLVAGPVEPVVSRTAARVADWLRGLVRVRHLPAEILGPAPAPLARIKGRWRWHALIRSSDRRVLGRILRYGVEHAPVPMRGAVRVVFDRDPVSLL